MIIQGIVSTDLPKDILSAGDKIDRDTSHGSQLFEEVCPDQAEYDLVGRPQPHMASFQQATGEAQYVDDIRKAQGLY